MRTELNNRIKKLRLRKEGITELIIHSKYAVLAFASLWLSVIFTKGSNQFIAMAVIFGLRWAFEGLKQTVQIFMQEKE